MLEKAFHGSYRYWSLVGILLLVLAIGAIAYVVQFFTGLGVTGLSRDVSWGLYIGQFTFLVGVAASAVMVVLPYYLHNYKAFGKITILGECLAIPSVLMCMGFIFVDMGQPTRILNVFLHPTPNSPMFWDTVVLFGYLVLNVVIGWTTFGAEAKGIAPPGWVKPLIILSIPWAVSIHTVTAFLYCGLAARPYWMTAILAPRFLASAFSAGPALLIILSLVVRKYTKFDPGREAIQKLGTIVTYAMAVNVFFIALELFTSLYSNIPAHMEHFQFMFLGLEGETSFITPLMWFSSFVGIVALVLLLFPRFRRNETILAWAAGGVFFSLWAEKGLALLVTGYIPTPLLAVPHYAPTIVEILISTMIWAFGFLVLTVLYKIVTSVREDLEQV